MIYGFCMTTRTDEPVDILGRCLPHDACALPPSISGEWHQTGASFTSDLGGLMLAFKDSEVVLAATYLDSGRPLLRHRMPTDTAVFGRRVVDTGHVLGVLRARSKSQIRAPVVQAVSIPVITFEAIPVDKPKQCPMKQHMMLAIIDSLVSHDIPVRPQIPAPLAHPGDISPLDNRMRFDGTVPTVKRNQAGRTVLAQQDWIDGSAPYTARRHTGVDVMATTGTAWTDMGGRSREVLLTHRTGKMNGHRGATSVVSRPRLVVASAGVSCCPNYTRSDPADSSEDAP